MTVPLHYYKATVLTVHDGDTAHLRLDRGLGLFSELRCRLAGINAPELSTGAPGAASRDWLANRLAGKVLWVHAEILDNYGRPLVLIYEPEPPQLASALSVNAEMVSLGLAVPMGAMKARHP